ncbi:MAG: DUF3592 domain-containing protein [Pararhodobacter sp.]|nr:DUF3592 domain-containing protein [Pararhodobacter sp.]
MKRPGVSIYAILMRQRAWLLAFGLVFTVAFGAVSLILSAEARQLAQHGVEAEATIVSLDTRTRRDSDGNRRTTYLVTYRFDLPGGETQRNRDTVSRGYYRSVSRGDQVTMRYLPDDPATAELERGSARRNSILFGLVALVAAGGTGGAAWWFWQRSAAMIRAARRGAKRTARVIAHVDSRARVNDRPLFQLHWMDSAYQEGHSLKHRAEELADWPAGSEITVYVDPQTGQAFWEEDLAPG